VPFSLIRTAPLQMSPRGTSTRRFRTYHARSFSVLPLTPALLQPPSLPAFLPKVSHFESWRPLDSFDRLVEAIAKLEDTQVLRPLDALNVPVKALPECETLQGVGERSPLDLLVEVGAEVKHLIGQSGKERKVSGRGEGKGSWKQPQGRHWHDRVARRRRRRQPSRRRLRNDRTVKTTN